MHRNSALVLLVCGGLAAASVACKGDSGSASTASPDQPPAAACPEGGAGAAPAGQAAPTIQVSDGDSVAIALVAIQSDIDSANEATNRAVEAPVKDFGKKVLSDATKSKTDLTNLAAKLGITPPDNPMSLALAQSSANAINGFGGVQGGQFDQLYIDSEVLSHATLIGLLDATLTASAVSTEYRAYLTALRTQEVAHLQTAQQLQRTVDAGQPDNGGGNPPPDPGTDAAADGP
jgi:predicted outer membrane protein